MISRKNGVGRCQSPEYSIRRDFKEYFQKSEEIWSKGYTVVIR